MSSSSEEITRRELVDRLFDDPIKNWATKEKNLISYLSQRLNCPPEHVHVLKNHVSRFFLKVKSKYNAAQRKRQKFYEDCASWLDETESFPLFKSPGKRGRPKSTDFEESSTKTKQRRTVHLQNMASASELCFAASSSYQKSGQSLKAKTLNMVSKASTDELKVCSLSLQQSSDKFKRLSPDMALGVMLDAQLTVYQYKTIRQVDKWKFPAYRNILEAKKCCYPPDSAFTLTETHVFVNLQDILNLTVLRLAKSIEDLLVSIDGISNLKLYAKWGIDGTSGFNQYKQKFNDEFASDASMLVTCFVPIQLIGDCAKAKGFVFWKNPVPSSSRLCRPLHLNYIHETPEISIQEMNRVETEISTLEPTTITFGDKSASVTYEMLFTMTDGKICNAVTETSSTLRCYICGQTSSQFNCLSTMLNAPIKKENLRFGLSVLHTWIRMFECLLHVSYKLCIAKWRVNKAEDKSKIEASKKRIQKDFKTKLGLIVDRPKPGYGSSNDGNTARRFFQNPEASSEITGINKNLIHRFHVILTTLSCGHNIDVKKFETYCLKTAVVFIKLYPWYYMPTSIHKILIHGPIIVSSALLPIGQLSEEAQEARNKEIKRFRESYARRCSREANLKDVFNRLLVTSDPFINSLRRVPAKNIKNLPPESINMLMPVNVSSNNDSILQSDEEYDTD